MTRVCDLPWVQPLLPGGDTEPRPPILRARREGDSRAAITHEAVANAVLACGRCDAAIEGWADTYDFGRSRSFLEARPCGCEVVGAPVWARNARRRG